LAVQADAPRPPPLPPPPSPAATRDEAAALQAWIATQPWAQPGPVGWVYLLCFRDPATGQHAPLRGNGVRGQYAGHYWGTPASSGFLKGVGWVGGGGVAELTCRAWPWAGSACGKGPQQVQVGCCWQAGGEQEGGQEQATTGQQRRLVLLVAVR